MKKILIFIIMFLIPVSVSALEDENSTKSSDIYLESLEIENYEFTPKFEKYSNLYTLFIKEEVDSLDIIAIPEDESSEITIEGDKGLIVGENEIKITVYNTSENKENIYLIIVTKEGEESLSTGAFEEVEIEPNSQQVGIKEMSFIAGGCLILIYFCFRLLFGKRRKQKNLN